MNKHEMGVALVAADSTARMVEVLRRRSATWAASAIAVLPKEVVEGNRPSDTVFDKLASSLFGSRYEHKLPMFDAGDTAEWESKLVAQESTIMDAEYTYIECDFGAVFVFTACPHFILMVAPASKDATLVVACTLGQYHAMTKAMLGAIELADTGATKH